MKVKVKKKIETVETIEVEMPFYYHYSDGTDYTSWDVYGRVDADGNEISIKNHGYDYSEEKEWSITVSEVNPEEDWSEYLKDKSDEATFNQALANMRISLIETLGEPMNDQNQAQSEEDLAQERVRPYISQINNQVNLVSLLYDIDLLPEQIVTAVNAKRLIAICALWKVAHPNG